MNHPSTTFPPAAVEALRRTVAGLIVYPSDPSYSSFVPVPVPVPGTGTTPSVVVVPDTEDAVRAAVDVARTHGLALASDVGPEVPGAAMLVLTHLLDELDLDTAARTATLGPGTSWSRLTGALVGTGLGLAPAGEPDSAVVDAVVAGRAPVLSARVVRLDGFVHVVAAPAPPVDDPGPWVVTAVVVPLTQVPSHLTHPDQEVPS